jgi:hypothetical protein
MPKNFKFTNDWIAGFTQSDGSFVVTFSKQNKGIPIRPVPVFNITQSITELDLFVALQKHLGVGKLYKNRGYSNDDDLKTIVDLAWNMNILGRRKISKEEYLNKFIKQKKKINRLTP